LKHDTPCQPRASDYRPSAADAWPACVTDDADYHLISDSPSSIARVEGYVQVMERLRGPLDGTAFTDARTIYAQDEGLESRLVRREDLHYPPIPEEEWEPGVDGDKQCSLPGNQAAYPDRCAGPARIAPILNDAFVAGQVGDGEPAVHAARIDAALLWFLYLSVYKEANTCFTSAAKDCDSSWAYYTGGANRAGGIGLAREVRDLSAQAHAAVWDGFSAFRCLRDLYPADDTASLDDLPPEGRNLFADAQAQLDAALVHGWAVIVRDRLERQDAACGAEAEANWAFLQIAGPVLAFEGQRRDADLWGSLAAIWDQETPTADDLESAVAVVDALFGCPQAPQ
jgi:hypothetical protein